MTWITEKLHSCILECCEIIQELIFECSEIIEELILTSHKCRCKRCGAFHLSCSSSAGTGYKKIKILMKLMRNFWNINTFTTLNLCFLRIHLSSVTLTTTSVTFNSTPSERRWQLASWVSDIPHKWHPLSDIIIQLKTHNQ